VWRVGALRVLAHTVLTRAATTGSPSPRIKGAREEPACLQNVSGEPTV